MSKLNILAGTILLLMSFSGQAKEYLGFNLGQDSFEKIQEELTKKKIKYTIEYYKSKNQQDITDLPVIKIESYPLWEKYGKIKKGELSFCKGTLSSISVGWVDNAGTIVTFGKDFVNHISRKEVKSSLYRTLDTAFRKKYEIMSYNYEHDGKIDALYKDETDVKITLVRRTIKPNMNPLNITFITTVTYHDNALVEAKTDMIQSINEDIASSMLKEKRKHDPDLLFAKDF